MKRLALLMIMVMFAVATAPAQAFTAHNLDITVQENGNAAINFTYQFNWFEYFVVFLRIADPAVQIQNALESNLGRTVVVNSVSPGMLSLDVTGFASLQDGAPGVTYTTPSLDFTAAQRYLKQQWFSGMVSADFSPAVSTVRFPDSYNQQFYNQDYIPGITHTVIP